MKIDWKPYDFQVPATLSETIYQSLKKALIDGEIKPGQRLQEKEIAALFNTSSTPVREAFFRLAAEKYLVINARKEVLAQDTTLEEVRELYESTGQEVLLDPVLTGELAAECEGCALALHLFKVVYTRRARADRSLP